MSKLRKLPQPLNLSDSDDFNSPCFDEIPNDNSDDFDLDKYPLP